MWDRKRSYGVVIAGINAETFADLMIGTDNIYVEQNAVHSFLREQLPEARTLPFGLSFHALPLGLAGIILIASSAAGAPDAQQILATKCFACHGPDATAVEGGLRLDTRDLALKGGESGKPAISPGDPAASLLLAKIFSDDPEEKMPPPESNRQLATGERETLRQWIADGASYGTHWAFKSLAKVNPAPVDDFIREKLSTSGLSLSPEAPSATIIRRIHLGLTGLPASPDDLAEWEKRITGGGSGAVAELVDSLLASPHYGEHWARRWLDLARYADSAGYERDADLPHAYQYRNFVIRSLNSDLPFDEFVRLQLAGDELAPDSADALAATGFTTLGPVATFTPSDTALVKKKARYDQLDDLISTTGSAMLSLTVGCARCHDHKFDPIPTRDYYRLSAVFLPSEAHEAPLSRPHRELELWKTTSKRELRESRIDALEGATANEKAWLREAASAPSESKTAYGKFGDKVAVTEKEWLASLNHRDSETLAALESKVSSAGKIFPKGRAHLIFDQGPQAPSAWIYGRGDVGTPEEKVTFGFLSAIGGEKTPEHFRALARERVTVEASSTYGRAALAEWLTDPADGAGALLARVAVNRIWQHHFGQGLVRTPDDFGVQGAPPTHPELLDFLAGELIRSGWRLKHVHRLILNSETYRQTASTPGGNSTADRGNLLFSYRRPIRLDAENIRDSILAVSGKLDPSLLGPAIRTPIPAAAMATRSRDAYPVVEESPEQWRRSIYLFVKRSVPTPMMEVFDAPDPSASCGQRNGTTVPTQALALLNDPFVRNQARHFAMRAGAGSSPPAEFVRNAFRLALSRDPASDESTRSLRFFGKETDAVSLENAVDFCHALYNLNEFIYVE